MLQAVLNNLPIRHSPSENHAGTAGIANLIRNETLLDADRAVALVDNGDGDGVSIEVDESLRQLLDLDSPRVRLGRAIRADDFTPAPGAPTPTQAYNHNIPIADRGYLHATHEELVRLYVSKIRHFNSSEHSPSEVTPYDRLRQKILFALGQTTGRNDDAIFMRRAFDRLHDFFIEHNHAIAEAAARHPELREIIDKAAKETVQRVVITVLSDKDIEGEALDIDRIVSNARAVAVALQHAPLLQQTDHFYSTDNCVEGAGRQAKRAQIKDLAEGKVVFPNLQSLLRFGPVGNMAIDISKNTDDKVPPGAKGHWVNLSITVAYYSDLIKKLYYSENPNTRKHKRIYVLMGKNSYQPKGSFPIDLPQHIPAAVRQENQKRLEDLIRTAQKRNT